MKIFVVDREGDSRKVLDILEQTPGNEIRWAPTGQEALEMTHGQQVDLLITEVILDPMNGFTLRNKMENRHPGVRTIFVSGYDLSPFAEHTAGYEVVAKPPTPQTLLAAIARTMGASGRPAEAAPAESAHQQQPQPVAHELPAAPAARSVPAAAPGAPRVVATPRATAVPAATPVATPRVTAVPAATPVATPRVTAVPAATPVATPRVTAVPAATPVATPRATAVPAATPAATPRATAVPTATPRVRVVPAATPVAEPNETEVLAAAPVVEPEEAEAPSAEPEAAPQVTPVPAAVPVATPRVTAVPAAEPATPIAQPAAEPATTIAQPAAEPIAESVSTPIAEPAAEPIAESVSTPIAQPAAEPIAEPVATPETLAVTPVEPAAEPQANVSPPDHPVAAPEVTAAPAPVPVPEASAAPDAESAMAPGATPVPAVAQKVKAVPAFTPLPRATSTPRATAVPAGAPRASAARTAAPPAVPRNAPSPAGNAGAVRAGRPAVAAVADPLLGKTIGAYRVECRLGKGKWGPVYRAIQTSMNRPVAMELLAADKAGDEAARQNFVATARAKAAVQHPHILSVYEADEADGHYFYTHEYVDGYTLAQLEAKGDGLSEPMALQTIKCVAQGLSHLHNHNIAHSIPDATDIYIGADGLPYLSNVAQPTEEMPAMQEEICTLGRVIQAALPGGRAQDRGLQAMLTRMGITNQLGFQSWPPLFQAIQAIEPKVIPADAFKLSAQDQAAIKAVDAARKRQKMVVIASVASLVLFLCALGAVIWWEFLRPETHDYGDEMVKIDAGDFIYGPEGQKMTLPTFYIDKYEVTMAEYEKFLEFLKANGNPTTYDSELQPAGLSHVPRDWEIFWGRASSQWPGYRTVRNVPISPDCPVFNVNYFDAYAYAKWKGRRLPTEQEWEKAARGPSGNLYPWGNQWDPTKLNAGGDYQSEPEQGYKPSVDGYTFWAPVDALQTDRSPYGVIGMAGNVSEWTDTWDPSKTYVVIRGGNYKSTAEQALATSSIKTFPQHFAETLGFRTASDNPPAK
jgi:formylglycine-generating enzyme required for sulfatase activity/CheY-like chemotaxis protein